MSTFLKTHFVHISGIAERWQKTKVTKFLGTSEDLADNRTFTIEAMALGKAVVASDVVGNKDCVRDGENGYLLPLDAGLFVEKICCLIENDAERQKMDNRSRVLFERDFLIDNRIKMLEHIYKS